MHPTANGQTTAEVETATSANGANDSSIANDASTIVSDGICMYLANETKKRAFTKDHIAAILVNVFNHIPARTTKKAEMLDELNKQVETSPGLLQAAVAAAAAAPLPPLPNPVVAAEAMAEDLVATDNAPSLPTTPTIPSPPVETFQAAASASNKNAHWLYFACKDALVTMNSSLTPLQLALLVYDTLLETDSDELDEDEGAGLTMELFGALPSQSGKRDINFIYAVSERATDMLYDKGCNEDALKNIGP